MKKIKFALVAGVVAFLLIAIGCKTEAGENSGNSNQTEKNQKSGDESSQSGESENTGSDETTWSNDLILVPGGTIIGADYTNNYTGVFPKGRTVTLSDFYMSKYEITQAEYKEVMQGQKISIGSDKYTLEDEPSYCTANNSDYAVDIASLGEKQERRPVEGVTWFDAVYYCNVRSEKEGLEKAYNISITNLDDSFHITAATVTLVGKTNGYRLPTEAEWEYAARGGDPNNEAWNYTFSGVDKDSGVTYNSSCQSNLDKVAWYTYNNKAGITTDKIQGNSSDGKGSHEVGKKAANRLALYDMSGNVNEWCYDWYNKDISTKKANNPVGYSSGNYRVVRGGSWCSSGDYTSVSHRSSDWPYKYGSTVGFRVVRSVQ